MTLLSQSATLLERAKRCCQLATYSEERQQRIHAYEQQQRVVRRQHSAVGKPNAMKRCKIVIYVRHGMMTCMTLWLTQRRHNDTLNTVQARLMRESDEAVADWVSEHGLREGWEQTAGELEWEVQRLQTALVVGDNTITRMRAERRSRCPDCGKYVRRDKK